MFYAVESLECIKKTKTYNKILAQSMALKDFDKLYYAVLPGLGESSFNLENLLGKQMFGHPKDDIFDAVCKLEK